MNFEPGEKLHIWGGAHTIVTVVDKHQIVTKKYDLGKRVWRYKIKPKTYWRTAVSAYNQEKKAKEHA